MTSEANKVQKTKAYRSNTERRKGTDTRTEEVKLLQGDRRSGTDRRK